MRVVRWVLVVWMAGLSSVLLAGMASAGGAVLDFDRKAYLPGQTATARTTFSAHVRGKGQIEDGPFFAYLLPGARFVGRGSIPANAIPLGPVTITQEPGSPAATARITFAVPDVPTGGYTLSLCNDPCTISGVGDLIGGWTTIVHTAKEAELLRDVDRLGSRVSHLEYLVRKAGDREEELTAELADAREERSQLLVRVQALEEESAAARTTSLEPARPASVLPIAVAIGLGVVAAIEGALLLRRRRAGPPNVVEETIEERTPTLTR